MRGTKIVLLSLFTAVMGALTAVAGTLDDAPFRIVLPSDSWRLDDSTAKNMGKDVFLVASITNTNTSSKSVIIKTQTEKVGSSSLDELCDGIRDQFSNPIVKKLSDEDFSFLGFKARRFTYEVNGTSYNEAIVFMDGSTGWTIACAGRADQKDEIEKILTFYQKNEK